MRCVSKVATSAVIVSILSAASTPSVALGADLKFKAYEEHNVLLRPNEPGGRGAMWGFWGLLKRPTDGTRTGSYRATCTWLAKRRWKPGSKHFDNRLTCTAAFSLSDGAGSSVVAQGLVERPRAGIGLFEHAAKPKGETPKLAIIGGTGAGYLQLDGYYVDLSTDGQITITNFI